MPVTGRGAPSVCEMPSLPHFVDNRLRDGGEAVSLTRRPSLTPQKILGTHFHQRMSRPQGHSVAESIS
jgi:hypothetical protein